MKLTPFSPEYLPQVLSLVVDNLESMAGFLPIREPAMDRLETMLLDASELLLAWDGKACMGFIWLEVRGKSLFVQALAVDDQHKRQGAGQRLLARAFSLACERQLSSVSLEVRGDNHPMIRLVQSMGFYFSRSVGSVRFYELPCP
ncbi:MAG TPA: GNAT family N-acetyltransferase [Thermoanaerobaculia bacterium]|nr:GNAT family N-acetyltransferase [Thermoanaerobaculia bacterium]HUM28585.1 GNAT family N-acetyltransferase [Thermoanaerobaculia bacterium]HXK66807.1 GNAT family N-acetyltransferase [Thermoanaerobaculia bacterium]